MSSFQRIDNGEIGAIFTSQEIQVLLNLTEQLLELLGDSELHTAVPGEGIDPFMNLMGLSTNEAPPEDPVLRRLLPNAYKDEREAAEFRRYTEHGLREKKRAHAMQIHEAIISRQEEFERVAEDSGVAPWKEDASVDRAALDLSIRDEDANAWLGGLNDLRLALAVRLGIGEQPSSGAPASHSSEDISGDEPGDKFGDKFGDKKERFELMAENDPMQAVYAVYSWLGWLQQSLLEAMLNGGDDHQAS